MSIDTSICKNIDSNAFNLLKLENRPEQLQTCEHLVYFGGHAEDQYDCFLYKGKLDDIQNSTCICWGGISGSFYSSYTWTNDARLLACEYSNGQLYEIDYETCDMYSIGGGGIGLNSIAYDPTGEVIFGCSNDALYKVNASTGEQVYIGNFGSGPSYMIGLSFDEYGELYGWDVGTDSLWTIDKETGDAYLVGSLGINLNYTCQGDFCKVDDILYLAVYMSSPQSGYYLVECDKNTGECTIISQFPDPSQSYPCFVIPWNFHPYAPSNYSPCYEDVEVPFNLSWDGGDPDSGDMVTYYVYLGFYEPPSELFATVGPYPANQKRIEFGPVSLPLYNTFYWKVFACDNYGASVGGPVCIFNTYCIIPPNEPTIEGPSKGRPGKVYDYTFVSTNPDNHTIKYLVEWGDGTNYESEFYESGIPITLNHSWDNKGTFILRAKAINMYDKESNWSELEINIPRNRQTNHKFLLMFFNRISNLERLLLLIRPI
jgi:hypothetical protein